MFICANCPCRCEEPCPCTTSDGCEDCRCKDMKGLRVYPLETMPAKTVQQRKADESQKT